MVYSTSSHSDIEMYYQFCIFMIGPKCERYHLDRFLPPKLYFMLCPIPCKQQTFGAVRTIKCTASMFVLNGIAQCSGYQGNGSTSRGESSQFHMHGCFDWMWCVIVNKFDRGSKVRSFWWLGQRVVDRILARISYT